MTAHVAERRPSTWSNSLSRNGEIRSSEGDSYDNALAETINGSYNAPWNIRETVELATLEWVCWFNHHRLLEPIGHIPPAEAEMNYYRQLSSHAISV